MPEKQVRKWKNRKFGIAELGEQKMPEPRGDGNGLMDDVRPCE